MEVGSIVALKSGGPYMTITSIDGLMANCKWFDDNSSFINEADIDTRALVELMESDQS